MRKALLILIIMVAASLFNTMVFAAVLNDEVTSIKLKEADGTSGQNTNGGSGVKTGHIQDGAITTSKIVDEAVTDAKISGVISGSKLGAHTHSGGDITDGTVSTTKIQDGAVTDAKITGPISASKISSAGLNADTIDGFHASDFSSTTHAHAAEEIIQGTLPVNRLATYNNVRIVHKGAKDGVHTFNTVSEALASITDNGAANPYTVLVMPGVYVDSFSTKDYVAIKGSGRIVTKITSSVISDSWTGTVTINSVNSPIESLTIENNNPTRAIAVVNWAGAPIVDSAIIAQGAITYGIVLGCSPFKLKRSEITSISTDYAIGMETVSYCGIQTATSLIEHSRVYADSANACAIQINNQTRLDIIDSDVAIGSLASSSESLALRVFGDGTIVRSVNSTISNGGSAGSSLGVWSLGTLMASTTRIDGPSSNGWGSITLKLLNCYDSSFNSIPNQ